MLTEEEKNELREAANNLPNNDFIYKEIAKHTPGFDAKKTQRESKALALWLGSLGEIDDDCPDETKRAYILITAARALQMSSIELDGLLDRDNIIRQTLELDTENKFGALLLSEFDRQKAANFEGNWLLPEKV